MRSECLNGILLVDKPTGMTSAAVVGSVKRNLRVSKVGHLGTLDPFASGLLPICLGEATKIARFLSHQGKTYSGVIKLGAATDTLDCTGRVIEEMPVPTLQSGILAEVRQSFSGKLRQIPPMFSAVKQGGVPLYKLARRGLEVERAPREIRVTRLELGLLAADALAIFLECSKGTYVRVLADEISRALGTCGHLVTLRRVGFGSFSLREAVKLNEVGKAGLPPPIISPAGALAGHRRFTLEPRGVSLIRQGQQQVLGRLEQASREGEIACLLDESGAVVAIAEASGPCRAWRVARVLTSQPGEYAAPLQAQGRVVETSD